MTNPWNRGSPVAVRKVTGSTSNESGLDSQHGSETFLSCILSTQAVGGEGGKPVPHPAIAMAGSEGAHSAPHSVKVVNEWS
jgi:hypothetical protein